MNFDTGKQESGFTLLEILVALALVVFMFAIVTKVNFTSRQDIEETLGNLERAIRFAVDEAALKNTVIRIHFLLDKTPQEYSLEYGPDDSFTLPALKTPNMDKMSLSEQEMYLKRVKKLNRQFNKIQEFQKKNNALSENIRIVGIGTSTQEDLAFEFESSIYVYPTGEKDSAIIIVGSDDEIVSLKINAFMSEFEREYYTIGEDSGEGLEEYQFNVAKDMYSKWLKE